MDKGNRFEQQSETPLQLAKRLCKEISQVVPLTPGRISSQSLDERFRFDLYRTTEPGKDGEEKWVDGLDIFLRGGVPVAKLKSDGSVFFCEGILPQNLIGGLRGAQVAIQESKAYEGRLAASGIATERSRAAAKLKGVSKDTF